MKKIYIVLTVLALAAFTSCQENEINYNPLEKGEIGFYLQGSRVTKSAGESFAPIKGEVIELGADESGQTFFLEETITNLFDTDPETKGTPAYSENVRTLYGDKFNAAVYNKSGVFEANGEFSYDSDQGKYVRKYSADLWDDAPLTFYMWMPGTLNDAVGVSDLTLDGGKISFTYDGTKLTTANAMQDILFTSKKFSGVGDGAGQYNDKEGSEILFHHALTGVKFAVADDLAENITIKSVTFNGLKDGGKCVITPRDENNPPSGHVDNPNEYSSGDGTTVVWSSLTAKEGATYTSGDYADPIDFESGSFAPSFYQGGNLNNLNDANATQTFWFIPQAMTSDVTLTIVYNDGGSEDITWTIDFGKTLAAKTPAVVWKAGELRTYTLRVDEVNVMIKDKVTVVEADPVEISYVNPIDESVTTLELDSYKGSTKTDVVITNTGDTDAYIRAAIVGQWLDPQGNPVFGFTDYTAGKVVLVDSWYQDQFGANAQHKQGSFTGLPGENWVKGTDDNYYYYKNIVPAGEEIPDPLFTKYTVGDVPGVAVAGEVPQIYFRLEIATQAISAKKLDGTDYEPYTAAWANAKNQK